MQNFYHNIGVWEKRQFFRRKLAKIAENCDHNIDPRSAVFLKNQTKNPHLLDEVSNPGVQFATQLIDMYSSKVKHLSM
jgi:hypothetical protein